MAGSAHKRLTISAVLVATVLGLACLSHQAAAIEIGTNEGPSFQLGAGGFDVLPGDKPNERTAGIFRGEYRLGVNLWLLHPFLGAEVTTDESVYGYGGFGLDIYLDDSWVLNPNAAVGAWSRGNRDALNLGSTIEFRTGAELDYRFSDNMRVGISFHHISNAGITKRNPGEEEALATFTFPLTFP
jgi:hypothetical protein